MGAGRSLDHVRGTRSRGATPLSYARRWWRSQLSSSLSTRSIRSGHPMGAFIVYSGPDIGTRLSLHAVTTDAAPHPLPALSLVRGARHLTFMPGGRRLVFLRGEIQHKNLWLVDLDTGVERQLTDFTPDFEIRDFDISPDGREMVVERVQDHSDVVLLDLPR